MTWNFQASSERAAKKWEETSDLVVRDVVRETDFSQISLNGPRRVTGAHAYVDVSNFTARVRSGITGSSEVLRLLHIWNREVADIASALGVTRVHSQGARLHAVAYRPISDSAEQAAGAVLLAAAARHAIAVFNDVFELGDQVWTAAAGVDHGRVVATRNGVGGDRELLFLGSAANEAAHLLRPTGVMISVEVAELLPEDFDDHVVETDECSVVTMTATQVEELVAAHEWSWTREQTRNRLTAAAEKFPSSCVSVSEPRTAISKDDLGLSDTKRVSGVSLFADLDGFTAYIEEAMSSDPDAKAAVRAFHVIRAEERNTAVLDFEALRIQYQGDRMQALVYRPFGDDAALALRAVRTAAALTSVAQEVVPEVVEDDASKPLAIGMALGEVLVSKVGPHGDRDVVVIGGSVADAASIQERLAGGTIGIDSSLHELLPAWLQDEFTWSSKAGAYTTEGLTFDALVDLEAEEAERQRNGTTESTSTATSSSPRLRPWSTR